MNVLLLSALVYRFIIDCQELNIILHSTSYICITLTEMRWKEYSWLTLLHKILKTVKQGETDEYLSDALL